MRSASNAEYIQPIGNLLGAEGKYGNSYGKGDGCGRNKFDEGDEGYGDGDDGRNYGYRGGCGLCYSLDGYGDGDDAYTDRQGGGYGYGDGGIL